MCNSFRNFPFIVSIYAFLLGFCLMVNIYAVEGEIPVEGEILPSCAEFCGSVNPAGPCYCDSSCIDNGDCCYDAIEVCPGEFPEGETEGESTEGEPVEGELDGFVCPGDVVVSQPATPPGTPGFTPDYILHESVLLDAGEVNLIFDDFTLAEAETLCSLTWWGVEVTAEGLDCTPTEKEFAVIITNFERGFDDPYFANLLTVTRTSIGIATMKGQEVTIYRYHADSLGDCFTLQAGDYFIVVIGSGTGVEDCLFGWLITQSGDGVYNLATGETIETQEGNLAFCLSTGQPNIEGESPEGESPEGESPEGESPEGEGEIEGEVPDCTAESPYGPEDPCYVEVVLADSYCCNGEWDNTCQTLYNDCAGLVPHPADTNIDWNIKLPEAIAYLTGWQQGSNPIGFAIRAAFIWQNGEGYAYDALQAPPNCWILAP